MALKRKKGKKKAVKKRALKKRTVKRVVVRKKAVAKKSAKKTKIAVPAKKVAEKIIGTVTHYFPKVNAAVIKLKAPLAVGDTIKIKGHTTDFTESISSIQINHVPVSSAKKGDEIGLLVSSRVRQNDAVYKP